MSSRHWSRIICFSTLLVTQVSFSQDRSGQDVFNRWVLFQHVYKDRNLVDMGHDLNDTFVDKIKDIAMRFERQLKPIAEPLKTLTDGIIPLQHQATCATAISTHMRSRLVTLYSLLEYDPEKFLAELSHRGFLSSARNAFEEYQINSMDISDIITKNIELNSILFAHEIQAVEDEYVFAVANRLAEYCYRCPTASDFHDMCVNALQFPLARYVISTIWHTLIGDGWLHWHADCLQELKKRVKQDGHKIVYLGGGDDVYRLLNNGIYNITIVDPMVSTRAKYYANAWQWLLASQAKDGGIGDTVTLNFNNPTRIVTLKRSAFVLKNVASVTLLMGQEESIQSSETVWEVFENNNAVGSLTFDRRPIEQTDFEQNKNITRVISLDELSAYALPRLLGGSNINPILFNQDFEIFVKQLRKPVDKNFVCNMRMAEMLNASELQFIRLASLTQ